MKKTPFILKALSIHKMPGFNQGLRSINDLAANINIVTGANASGKSSTARIIQQLIWHDKTKGLSAEGSVLLDKTAWEIKIDSEKIIVQRNGIEDEINGIPAAEGKHRYLLALHNLVDDKDSDLAKEIARLSIGGYNLDAVKEDLKYSSRPTSKGASEYKLFEDTEKAYKDVRNQQKALKKEEEHLSQLEEEKEHAIQAKIINEFYNKTSDYLQTKLAYENLTEQLKTFPNSMEKLSGEEYHNIVDFDNQIEACNKTIDKANNEAANSQEILEKLSIPREGVHNKIINEIEERLDTLRKLANEIKYSENQIIDSATKEIEILKVFDEKIDPSKWETLKIEDLSGLNKMLKDANQILGEQAYLKAEIEYLEIETKNYTSQNQNSEIYSQGIKTLSDWLKQATNNNKTPLWIVVVSSALGVITGIATLFFGYYGLFGLILILFVLIYAYIINEKQVDLLQIRQNDFIKSGLKAPAQWETNHVTNRLEELIENLRDSTDANRLYQRLNSAKDNLKKLQSRINNLHKTRNEWINKLQTTPAFLENEPNDFSSLYWFLSHIKEWQEAHLKKELHEADKLNKTNKYKNELNQINDLFSELNFNEVYDEIQVKISLSDLKNQEATREEHSQLLKQKAEQIKAQNKIKETAEKKRISIYETLGIETNEKDKVQALIKQLAEFKQIAKDHYAAQQSYLSKENLLKAHSYYKKHQEEINHISVDEAVKRANESKDIAEQLVKIQKDITEIETRIKDKKKGHELEDLLSLKEEALNKLGELYKSNLSAATGDLIISQLKKESQNQNRPKVFKRANEIFNKITNGRYELMLGEHIEPSFQAYDTVLKLGQNLSELSTGTRVQLLLSLRLAYIETVETSVKLPILADELLANSDEYRAKAIIKALIEISKDGRQIFYFTAQADEVYKWQAHLETETEIEHKIIQLQRDPNETFQYKTHNTEIINLSLNQNTARPNGKNHEEYGKLIQKQSFNILLQNSNELSLWYLIEDVELLYACLNKGIKNWGQLESYYQYNGKIEQLNKETFKQIKDKIEILKRFQTLYKKGRSLPIDRTILEQSNAITPAFIDKVSEKLNELNGNPKQLLHALRNGDIPRFRNTYADQLEQYLIAEKYMNTDESLNTDEIIIKLNAFISNINLDTKNVEVFINRILSN